MYPSSGTQLILQSYGLISLWPGISGVTTNSNLNSMNISFNSTNIAFIKTGMGQLLQFKVYLSNITNNSYFYYESGNVGYISRLRSAANQTDSLIFNGSTYFTAFAFTDQDLAIFVQSSNIVYKYNLTSNLTTQVLGNSNEYTHNVTGRGNKIIIWRVDSSNMATNRICIYYANGSFSKNISLTSLNVAFGCDTRRTLKYDEVDGFILKLCQTHTQIWSQNNSQLLSTKVINATNSYDANGKFWDGVFCGPYLVIATNLSIIYYSKTTWRQVSIQSYSQFNPSFKSLQELICLSSQGHIGFIGLNSTGNSIIYNSNYNLFPTSTNSTNSTSTTSTIINSTNTINSTNSSTSMSSNSINLNISNQTNNTNVSNLTQNNGSATVANNLQSNLTNNQTLPSQSQPKLSQNKQKAGEWLSWFNQKIMQIINSSQYHQTINATATIVGVVQTNPLFRELLKPLLYLFDQFWLYRFHSTSYTQVFDVFTNKTDLFLSLRLKPQFLQQIKIEVNEYEQKNIRYVETHPFSSKKLQDIFVLLSIQDVYTFSLGSALIQFAIVLALKKSISKIQQKGKVLSVIYRYLQSSAIWWNILISFVQTNIVVVVFYIAIQFQCFYTFNYFSKINATLSGIIFAFILYYSYVFYLTIFRYQTKKFRSQILSSCRFNTSGFWLQMVLNCLRRFHGALFHGSFINNHFLQLSSLIFMDFMLGMTVIWYRKQFKSKIVMVLTFVYFLTFLALDSVFFFCTQFLPIQPTQFYSNYMWNFIVIILVLIITLICLLQMMINIYFSLTAIKKYSAKIDETKQGDQSEKTEILTRKRNMYQFRKKIVVKQSSINNVMRSQQMSPIYNKPDTYQQKLLIHTKRNIYNKIKKSDPPLKPTDIQSHHKFTPTFSALKTLKIQHLQ